MPARPIHSARTLTQRPWHAENGQRAQQIGLYKDAVKYFDRARESIQKARELYDLVSEVDSDMEAQWARACNDREGCPMLTREDQEELEGALRERDKLEGHWAQRGWVVAHVRDRVCLYACSAFCVFRFWV
jgi:hypothetical protein